MNPLYPPEADVPVEPSRELVGSVEWPDIVLPSVGEMTLGRSGGCQVRLTHRSISGQHAQVTVASDGSVQLADLGSKFGTTVNGTPVMRVPLRKGDLIRFGSSPPYQFDGRGFRNNPDALGVNLSLRDVRVVRGRPLIAWMGLTLSPGSYTAVLGPSGAGKSVLTGVLSTTIEPSGGRVLADNLAVSPPPGGFKTPEAEKEHKERVEGFRATLGFVTQEDIVNESLTVAENLHLAAQIRIGDKSPAELDTLVSETMASVALTEHAAKPVAVLSGGQKKRVSIAIELLTRPRLLLLDEPTSGLDPGMATELMDTLRGLSRQGVTIACTTHTLDTLHYFDQVVLLGRVRLPLPSDVEDVAAGRPIRQYPLPLPPVAPGAPAPLYPSVGTIFFQGSPSELLPTFGVSTLPDLYAKLEKGENLPRPAGIRTVLDSSAGPAIEPPGAEGEDSLLRTGDGPPRLRRRPVVGSTPTQIRVVALRSGLGLRRDREGALLAVAQPVLLAGLILLSQSNQTFSCFANFFLVLAALWMGMTVSVRELVRERKHYIRDRLAGLRPNAYIAGKAVFGFAVAAAQALLLWSVAWLLYQVGVLENDIGRDALSQTLITVGGVLSLLLAGVGGAAIGFGLSAVSATERAAVSYLPLALLPLLLLSRVAYGEAVYPISDADRVFTSVSKCRLLQRDEPTSSDERKGPVVWQRTVVGSVSLLMLTRPTTANVELLGDSAASTRSCVAEWLYLLTLLGLHVGSAYLLFRRGDRVADAIR